MIQTTDSSGAEKQGTPITGATMPSGGKGSVGWLSAIWKAITDRLPSTLVSGRLDVNVGNTPAVTVSSMPLPAGAATETTLAALDAKVTTVNTGAVVLAAGSATIGNVNQAGIWSVTATQPTGSNLHCVVDSITLPGTTYAGATVKTSDYDTGAGIDTVPMLGIALPGAGGAVPGGTASAPVRIDPTGSTAQPVTGTFWQATQPISAASLPLPTGAATEATLSSLNGKLPAAATLGDGAASVNVSGIAAYPMLWCASYGQYSRAVNHDTVTLLTSAARTAITFSGDQLNKGHRGILVSLEVSVAPGGGITLSIQGRNPLTGTWYFLNANSPVITTGTGIFTWELSPGAGGGDSFTASFVVQRIGGTLPLEWRIRVGHATGASYTYSVAAQLLR